MERLIKIITEQQAGHENEPLFMIGEQLKDIAEREPICRNILAQDLEHDGMKLADAAKQLKDYSDKHRGKSNCFCITPKVAEDILRKFYGLPTTKEASGAAPKSDTDYIDITSFL